MPGTLVAIGLNGPPWAWPVLGSNVSVWLGPPVIHKRMHDFLRFGSVAARAARVSIHPEADAPMTPAEASRINWRREYCGTFGRFMERFLPASSRRACEARR